MGRNFYYDMWQSRLGDILGAMKSNSSKSFPITVTELVGGGGDRQDYEFVMEINEGKIKDNGSSAVYRDLKSVLENSSEFRMLSKDKVFRLKFKNIGCGTYLLKVLCDLVV